MVLTGSFASAADLDVAVGCDVFEDHASLFELEDLIIGHGQKEGFRALLGTEKEGLAKGDDFYGVNKIIFLLVVAFAATDG